MATLPDPQSGLVIRYAYLWRSEAARGREEGTKDRPCAVVLTSRREGERTRVWVAPITHSPPEDSQGAVEIPSQTKVRLNLDPQQSWIVTNEVNGFTWPGPDIRAVDPKRPTAGFAYGFLPEKLTLRVAGAVREHMLSGKGKMVDRDDNAMEM